MERRDFLKSTGAATLGGVLAGIGSSDPAAAAPHDQPGRPERPERAGQPAGQQPNIVFILVDEMRFPVVFPQGISTPAEFLRAYMPNTYKLWQGGVKFEQHYTAATACSPARGTIVTGLYSHQEWLAGTKTVAAPSLQPEFPTYGKLLRSAGYETPYIGKWHLSDPPSNGSGYLEEYGFQGLTIPDPEGTNGQGLRDDPGIADQAVQWLQGRRSGQPPFCLTVSFVNPHDKQFFWAGTEGNTFEALFAGKPVRPFIQNYASVPGEDNPPPLAYPELPPNWETVAQLEAKKPSTHTLFRSLQQLVWGGASEDRSIADFAVAPSPIEPNRYGLGIAPFRYWKRGLDLYTYVMGLVDKEIGRVVEAVPPSLRDSTVFVFGADHGDYAGAHGFLSGKLGTLYEEAWHLPLIVHDPSGRFTSRPDMPRKQLTSSVDLLPMFVTLGHGGDRSWLKGDLARLYGERLDLVRLLRDPGAPGRDHVLFASDEPMPVVFNYNRAPTHLLGVRTAEAKLGVYTTWLPLSTRLVRESMQVEYYDYRTPGGRAETEPGDPRSGQAQALLNKLLDQYVPQEMEGPLPLSLRPAALRGRLSYVAYIALVNAYSIGQLIEGRRLVTDLGYGDSF